METHSTIITTYINHDNTYVYVIMHKCTVFVNKNKHITTHTQAYQKQAIRKHNKQYKHIGDE